MKRIIFFLWLPLFFACSEDDLTPQVDVTPEYEEQLKENASKSETDAKLYEWYQKYNTAFLYDFTEADFRWMWSSEYTKAYVAFDKDSEEDMALLADFVVKIEEQFLANYDEEFLQKNLPYKIFLVRDLWNSISTSGTRQVALSNELNAMVFGCMTSATSAFSASKVNSETTSVFATFWYDKIEIKPEKFIAAQPVLKYSLLSWPVDPEVEADLAVKPDWDNEYHRANVCGYIRSYDMTGVKEPSDAQDYADYLNFLSHSTRTEIYKITSFYWRVAWRATLFMEYYLEVYGEDLIATQNANCPDDPVTMADFAY